MSTFYTNVKQYGNSLLYIGYENGIRVQEKIKYQPELFVPDQDNETSDQYSYDGIPLKRIEFSDINSAKDFISNYGSASGTKIYGHSGFNYQFIANEYRGIDVPYVSDFIRIFGLDIETYSGNQFPDPDVGDQEITAITISDSKTKKKYVWGQTYSPGGKYKPHLPNVVYKEFDDEVSMLHDFVVWWSTNYPDIITGWNTRGYDVKYIINRIRLVIGDTTCNKLSPWGRITSKTSNVKRFNTVVEESSYEIWGISELDYMDLYKKYNLGNEESFSLDFIAEKNLGIKKLEFDGTLHDLYCSDYQKYVEYNIHDVTLIDLLEEKLKFIELILNVSYSGKVATYNDSLGTVKYWETKIYNYLVAKNQQPYVKGQEDEVDKDEQYEGAYVVPPVPGLYRWVVSFDLTSLYPSLIRTINIGTETKIKNVPAELAELIKNITPDDIVNRTVDLSLLKKYNYSIAGNGVLYSREQPSFLCDLMATDFAKRKVYQKTMKDEIKKENGNPDIIQIFNIKQHSTKIVLNSAYGACGNKYFQYYDVQNAEAITLSGQVVSHSVIKDVNKYINGLMKTNDVAYVVYGDTDSIYITLGDLVDRVLPGETNKQKITDFLDKFSEQKIQPVLKKCFEDLCEYMNAFENHLDMKREIISDVAIWTAKKRYAMSVYDKEGKRYTEPELKITGIEIIKTSTPKFCRDKLKKTVSIILHGTESELQKYVANVKDEFKKLKPDQIAFPRGVSDMETYYDSKKVYKPKCPIHVRAALLHNKLLIDKRLEKTYPKIVSKDKMKFVHIRLPNPLHEDVIGFTETLPKEFGLDKYIDYETQFQKAFMSPLEILTDVVRWNPAKEASLGDMFF